MVRLILALSILTAPAMAQDAGEGAATFARYCAACHGDTAQGDGWLGPVLDTPPPDLTALSSGNGGIFPLTRVVWQIDGRDPVRGHGGEMPVFGEFFTGQDTALRTAAGQPILTDLAIADLVAYLQEIQQ